MDITVQKWVPVTTPQATGNKYQIIQSNGQRIYCPPSTVFTPRPPRGTEIFVGNLPRNLFEDELIPVFSQVGPIYKLRLMMDFTGNTRGFAFISYFTLEAANSAVENFNNYPIRKEAFITVHVSLDNCRLYFGNIPRDKTAQDVKFELVKFIEGIVDVIAYQDAGVPFFNRGFVFVEFESHALAAIARRKMLAGFISLWGRHQKIFVDWAEPEPIVHPIVLMQVTILFLSNVPISCSPYKLKIALLEMLDNPWQIVRTYKKDNYAFIHFDTRIAAERAFAQLKQEPLIIDRSVLEVEWARPVDYSKKHRWNEVPDNFCVSVPPRTRKMVERSKQKSVGSIGNKSSSSNESAPETEGMCKNICSRFSRISLMPNSNRKHH